MPEVEDNELVPSPEELMVLGHRRRVLRQAGASKRDAALLAASPQVDLHQAVRMLCQGCPSWQAVKILL